MINVVSEDIIEEILLDLIKSNNKTKALKARKAFITLRNLKRNLKKSEEKMSLLKNIINK